MIIPEFLDAHLESAAQANYLISNVPPENPEIPSHEWEMSGAGGEIAGFSSLRYPPLALLFPLREGRKAVSA
jgi:hypothetical protein